MATTIKVNGVDRSASYMPDEIAQVSLRFVAQDGEVGQGSAPIPDPAGTQTPYAGESFKVEDGATVILDGFVGPISRERGAGTGARLVNAFTIGDENAVLHGFRAYKWSRPAESTRTRFLAFLAAYVPWVTDTTWVTSAVTASMATKTYTTETLFDELMQEIKDLTGNVAFVENHRAHLHPPTAGITGSLSFTDGAPNYSTSFPIIGVPRRSKDPMTLRDDVMVVSPTHFATATDATAITRHDSGGLKHQALVQIDSGNQAQVDAKAAAILADSKAERVTYEFESVPLTAAQLASIPVGCLVVVTSSVLGLSASTQRIGAITAKYKHPGRWQPTFELGFPVRSRSSVGAPRVVPNVCCPPWDGTGSPASAQDVLNELVWTGDGTTVAGTTAFPYMAGSLAVWVAGLNTSGYATETDPTTGAFTLSFAPTAGQTIRANYVAA